MQQKEKDKSGVYYIKSGMELSSPFIFLEKKIGLGKYSYRPLCIQ